MPETSAVNEVGTFVTTVSNSLKDQINLTTLGTVLVAAVAISVPLFIGWFIYRKIKGAAASGLKKGKLG